MRQTVPVYILASVLLGAFFIPSWFSYPEIERITWGSLDSHFTEGTMLLTGDIFLGRDVERRMEKNGDEYPFLGIRALTKHTDLTVGNFEAAIPEEHVKTEDGSYAFSVEKRKLEMLKNIGFDVLSLANNHTLDFGDEGYNHTLTVCREYALSCAGHPLIISSSSLTYHTVGSTNVGIFMLHTLFEEYATTSIKAILDELNINSEVQIVYVHWGAEYEAESNEQQAALARFLIDNGADLVVGHHPHVVQDIEIYNDKLIVYSLGNFIFDQYFNDEVQTGLALKLRFKEDRAIYDLIPISSVDTPAQPRLLAHDEAREYLRSLTIRNESDSNSHEKLVLE